ncbi:hypothetical protein D3C87_488770 [compost metagenome]
MHLRLSLPATTLTFLMSFYALSGCTPPVGNADPSVNASPSDSSDPTSPSASESVAVNNVVTLTPGAEYNGSASYTSTTRTIAWTGAYVSAILSSTEALPYRSLTFIGSPFTSPYNQKASFAVGMEYPIGKTGGTPGSSLISYTETGVGGANTKVWGSSGGGTLKVLAIDGNQAKVSLEGVAMAPAPGSTAQNASGSFTLDFVGMLTMSGF